MYRSRKPAVPTQNTKGNIPPDSAAAFTPFQSVLAAHRAGRLAEAEEGYRLILFRDSGNADAFHMLGILYHQNGNPAEAEFLIRRALAIREDAIFLCSLGKVLVETKRPDEAEAAYRQAIALSPDYANAHYNLGNLLEEASRLSEAEVAYRRTLELRPDYIDAHYNLGNLLKQTNRLHEAEDAYRRALGVKSDFVDAHINLGLLLQKTNRLPEAEVAYRRAIKLSPDCVNAHSNLGNALRELGHLDGALASYRRALEIKSDFAEAHVNLGNALQDLGQFDSSVASYRRALEIKPDFVEAHNNLGHALKEVGDLVGAVASCHRALEIDPDFVEAHSNLLFIHNYLSEQPATILLAKARRYGDLVVRQSRPHKAWQNVADSGRCLRVGLVSGDLNNHPVGYFADGVLAALASHAVGRLELFAYPSHSRTDALTRRIKACCHGWQSAVGLSDEILAQRIRDDGIDILIDLSGHTGHNRLPMFAWKPAPVQVSWLGYFATTGLAAMDYLIADPWTLPESEEENFTEKIWRMPETRLCFTVPDVEVQVLGLPALANNYITFGCFNNLAKMNDAVVALWARVLASVPDSRLFLKAKQFGEASVCGRTIERFASHGVVAHRLILNGPDSRADYLAAYGHVDIALDPFPYTGGTTSAESLWMGVPVLTMAGEHLLSRQGVGLLMNSGLSDWVADGPDDYVARAVIQAGNIQRLATLRKGLRQQVLDSPIFDAPRFAQHFEAALRGMWTQWCVERQARPL